MFGGVNQRPQVAALRRGIDLLVATPGRLLDLHNQGFLNFDHVEHFVLDEADRMLDMGFIHDIRRVLALLPERRQNLLFSATMPGPIVKLSSGFLHDPVHVQVDPESVTVDRIEQSVMFVSGGDKKHLLRHLMADPSVESAIVFTRTKHRANRVAKQLVQVGVEAAAIHGNKSRALAGFRMRPRSSSPRTRLTRHRRRRRQPCGQLRPAQHLGELRHRIGRTARAGREVSPSRFATRARVSTCGH